MNSFITLRWNQGGRKVCSATIQRGGKMTKSQLAVPRRLARRGQHGEDRRVRMVEADRADRVEAREIVFVGRVIAVPGDDVERRMVELGRPEIAHRISAPPRPGASRSSKAATGVRKSRGLARPLAPIGPSSGRRKHGAVILADIAARRAVEQLDAEAGRRAGSPRSRPARPSSTPSSVASRSRPCCGTISSSPSAS